MGTYAYKALDETGSVVKGSLDADSPEGAERILLGRSLLPTEIKAVGQDKPGLLERLARVQTEELILFTKQLRTLNYAGVDILRSLEILEQQTQNPRLRRAPQIMAKKIREGSTLHDAFAAQPHIFSPLYLSMIRVGEQSGTLPQVLDRLTYIIEHDHKVRSEIKAAMRYPIIVLCFLGVAFFILLTFVIPQFVGIFQQTGLELPMPTRMALSLHHFLRDQWLLLLIGTVGGVVALKMWLKTARGRLLMDRFLLKIPLFGTLFTKAAMSRFASIFSILQASGMPVLTTIEILSGAIGNSAVAYEFNKIGEKLHEGRGIAGPLSEARYFTPMVINMVAIGEESGNIEGMMKEVATHYDIEVAFATKRLSDAVAPLLTVGLAVVVGFFALAIFLPMWDMTKMVK